MQRQPYQIKEQLKARSDQIKHKKARLDHKHVAAMLRNSLRRFVELEIAWEGLAMPRNTRQRIGKALQSLGKARLSLERAGRALGRSDRV